VTLFNNLVRLDKVDPSLAAKESVSSKEMKDSSVSGYQVVLWMNMTPLYGE
jgi:hypothetical protein